MKGPTSFVLSKHVANAGNSFQKINRFPFRQWRLCLDLHLHHLPALPLFDQEVQVLYQKYVNVINSPY